VNRLAKIIAAFALLVASVGAEQPPRTCFSENSIDSTTGCILLETATLITELAALRICRVDQAINRYQLKVTGKSYEPASCKKL
jgi:hypothetical protein